MTKRLTALLLTLTLILGLAAAVSAAALDCNRDHLSSLSATYIGNSNTGKFHFASCRWVSKMYDYHKVYFDSRDEAINAGYVPCKVCRP